MNEVGIIGIDLAKRVFQLHGAAADGSVVFRKKLTRAQLVPFLASQPACIVAMGACGTAHYWGREAAELGHEVRLMAPMYVEAVCEAAEERRGGRGGDRGGGHPADHALRGPEERSEPGAGDAVSHPRSAGAPAHADDQRAAGKPGGVRVGGGTGRRI